MSPRKYESPAREKAKTETRDSILQALIRVVLDDGIHAFSVAAVAEQAGVSHRTVYRHFPTREALLEALATRLAPLGAREMPGSVDEAAAAVGTAFEAFGEFDEAMRAYVLVAMALGRGTETAADARLRELVEHGFPHLPADDRHEAAALIGTVASAWTWFRLTSHEGLDGVRAGRAARWAVDALVADLRARDRAAAST